MDCMLLDMVISREKGKDWVFKIRIPNGLPRMASVIVIEEYQYGD